jgi:heptaprenylglyceryl phosphate synthase
MKALFASKSIWVKRKRFVCDSILVSYVVPWTQWDHVTKVDPDKALHNGNFYASIADTGTDAIIIGGTTNVTETSVQLIFDTLSSTEILIFVEPTYRPSSHAEGLSSYLLPIILKAAWREECTSRVISILY